jgi:hypothetical protein
MDNHGLQSSKLIYSHYAPYMVLGGLSCTTNFKGRLAAVGDASDDPDLNVGVATTGATTWSIATQIDTTSSVNIIGNSGVMWAADLNDGEGSGGDADFTQNGEIVFGGTNSAQGGYLFMLNINLFGNTVDGSQEIITFTLTPVS